MAGLTVFTPTYNRRELLKRVYDSLLNQTVKDFVWLIVDDGSTDDTRSLVMEWIDSAKITIRYEYCENGGKMRAHNRGVRLCDTQLFVIKKEALSVQGFSPHFKNQPSALRRLFPFPLRFDCVLEPHHSTFCQTKMHS